MFVKDVCLLAFGLHVLSFLLARPGVAGLGRSTLPPLQAIFFFPCRAAWCGRAAGRVRAQEGYATEERRGVRGCCAVWSLFFCWSFYGLFAAILPFYFVAVIFVFALLLLLHSSYIHKFRTFNVALVFSLLWARGDIPRCKALFPPSLEI